MSRVCLCCWGSKCGQIGVTGAVEVNREMGDSRCAPDVPKSIQVFLIPGNEDGHEGGGDFRDGTLGGFAPWPNGAFPWPPCSHDVRREPSAAVLLGTWLGETRHCMQTAEQEDQNSTCSATCSGWCCGDPCALPPLDYTVLYQQKYLQAPLLLLIQCLFEQGWTKWHGHNSPSKQAPEEPKNLDSVSFPPTCWFAGPGPASGRCRSGPSLKDRTNG